MTTVILFIIVFSVIVIAHELGHFLLAKANGITVVEFSVGMGLSCSTSARGEPNIRCACFP